MENLNITTKICGVKLNNPTVLASGILGVTASSLIKVAKKGAGAVTTKSIGLKERKGSRGPILLEFRGGLINAVGLSNPGIEESLKEINLFKSKSKIPIIASIFAPTKKEFGQVAKKVSEAGPDFIEVNISCPNVESEFGKPFAKDIKLAAKVTEEVKKNTKIPVIVKLSPNVDDIKSLALAVESAGADCISAINTVGPGMIIDIKTAKPVLSNKVGGVSGPAIKPIAVRCIFDIYEAVKIPIIGIGGILTGQDAIEMIMAGASAIGIGSAVYYRGIDVFKKICQEIRKFMKENNYENLEQMIGKAHG